MGRKSSNVGKTTAPGRKKNLKHTATSTAFRLARRWSRGRDRVTVKKLRKLIDCIQQIGKDEKSISAELSRYLCKRILMDFIEGGELFRHLVKVRRFANDQARFMIA